MREGMIVKLSEQATRHGDAANFANLILRHLGFLGDVLVAHGTILVIAITAASSDDEGIFRSEIL